MVDVINPRMGYSEEMDAKRRLPVVSSGDGAADPKRAPWQWVGFGTVAIFVVWLPLSAAASLGASALVRAVRPTTPSSDVFLLTLPVFVGLSVLALGLAAFVGGFVVGRWGDRDVSVREAILAGLVAVAVAIVVSWVSFGFSASALLVAPIPIPFAALGGKLGLRSRR
jgi:hypothetical protein